jgi:hypothetical protein
VKKEISFDTKIKRDNQRDDYASFVISKPTTISGGIESFFPSKLNNEEPSKRPKHNNERSKASNKQFTIKQEKGY